MNFNINYWHTTNWLFKLKETFWFHISFFDFDIQNLNRLWELQSETIHHEFQMNCDKWINNCYRSDFQLKKNWWAIQSRTAHALKLISRFVCLCERWKKTQRWRDDNKYNVNVIRLFAIRCMPFQCDCLWNNLRLKLIVLLKKNPQIPDRMEISQ